MTRLLPWLIAAAAFLPFVPSLESLFVNWDDRANFVDNPHFLEPGLGGLSWMFSTFHLAHYQPVTWLTWSLDRAVWGTNPFGYHLTNLLLHCATTVVFWFLCRRLLKAALPEAAEFHPYAAAWAALAFAVHPLRVEAVAWATERRELVSAFLYLSAVSFHVARHQPPNAGTRPWSGWVSILGVLAMFSNVRTVSLPVVLLILDYYPLGRSRPPSGGALADRGWRDPGIWKEKIPLFLAALIAGLIGLMAQATTSTLIPVGDAGFLPRVGQSCFGVGFYLWKTFAPGGLAAWYGDTYAASRVWVAVVGGLSVAFLTAGLAWNAARGRGPGQALLAGWLWYLVTLSPSLGLIKSGRQIVADRYSYLPCLALAALAAGGLAQAWLRSKGSRLRGLVFSIGAAAAVLCLPVLAGLTWKQCRVWNDSLTLWSRAFSIDRRSVFVRVNYGIALLQDRRFEAALKAFEAIREDSSEGLDPNTNRDFFSFIRLLSAMTHTNWGVDLAANGRPAEAVPHFERALNYNPDVEGGHNNLGLALLRSGRTAEAAAQFRAAVRRNPRSLDGRLNLASALALSGRLDEAEALFEAVLRDAPGDGRALSGLERTRRLAGKPRR